MTRFFTSLVLFALAASWILAQQPPTQPKKVDTQTPPAIIKGDGQPKKADESKGNGPKKDDDKIVDDLAAIKKQIQELTQKRQELQKKEFEIKQKIEKSDDVKELQKAVDQAEKAHKKAMHDQSETAQKALGEATAALKKLVAEKTAQNKDFEAVQKGVAELEEKKADAAYQAALAALKLHHPQSPIARKIAADPELAKLKLAAQFGKSDAVKAYNDAKKAKFDNMEDAKKLKDEIAAAQKESKAVEKALSTAAAKLHKLKAAIEQGNDPDLKEARDKVNKANKAVFAVYSNKEILDLSNRTKAARDVVHQKIIALQAGSQELADLHAQSQKLTKQIAELHIQQSKLQLEKQKKKLDKNG